MLLESSLFAPEPPVVLTLVEAHVTPGYIPDPAVGARGMTMVRIIGETSTGKRHEFILDLELSEARTLGLDIMESSIEHTTPPRGIGGGGD